MYPYIYIYCHWPTIPFINGRKARLVNKLRGCGRCMMHVNIHVSAIYWRHVHVTLMYTLLVYRCSYVANTIIIILQCFTSITLLVLCKLECFIVLLNYVDLLHVALQCALSNPLRNTCMHFLTRCTIVFRRSPTQGGVALA